VEVELSTHKQLKGSLQGSTILNQGSHELKKTILEISLTFKTISFLSLRILTRDTEEYSDQPMKDTVMCLVNFNFT
jgi:hypothetical protein